MQEPRTREPARYCCRRRWKKIKAKRALEAMLEDESDDDDLLAIGDRA